jgi:iron complex outermembrane recepter protein
LLLNLHLPLENQNTLKQVFLLIFILFYSIITFAQGVRGIVVDNETNEPIPFVNVRLFEIKDTTNFNGGLSNINGKFSIQAKPGLYKLRISYVGYLAYVKDSLRISTTTQYMDTVFLQTDRKMLEGVVIKAEREDMVLEVDKKVFNVSDNVVTAGGTALDILNQLPTVDVDVDGNVTLRGSGGVIILINGKPSGLTGAGRQAMLEQIPAANIERVEIITNPSAKYDSEGTTGIINIILKNQNQKGWHANVTGGIGTNHKYNGSASFSIRRNKFTLSTTYGYRYNNSWREGNSERLNFFRDTSFYIFQESNGIRQSESHSWNGNLDYSLNKKNTISLNWMLSTDNRTSPEDVFYIFADNKEVESSRYLRATEEDRTSLSSDLGLQWRKTFDKEGKDLVLLANVSYSDRLEDAIFRQDETGAFRQLQNTVNNTRNILPVVQLDFVQPLKKKDTKVEMGLKSTIRLIDDRFDSDTFNYTSNEIDIHYGLTNEFMYNEYVNAAYISYTTDFKWLKFQSGLRAEQTIIDGLQRVNNQKVQRNFINLFPSVFLTRNIKKGQDIQLSYSRRISRPGLRSLNPFAEQTDPFNLRTGNPTLMPEMIDAVEATYFLYKKGDYISGTTYFRKVNNMIQRFRTVSQEGVATMTYLNMDYSNNLGLEGIVRKKIKDFNLTLNLNMFRNEVFGTNQGTTLSVVNYSWFSKAIANYKLNKRWDFQGSYFYRGRITYVQGTIEPMHGLDVGFKVNVLKEKGAFTVNLTDAFNTKVFIIDNSGENFEGSSRRNWESRILTVNFTYKFGNDNPDWEKKSRQRNGRPDGGGDDMDF